MDTIASIATAVGAGGIAVIRISGPEAKSVLSRVFVPHVPQKMSSRMLTYGYVMENGQKVDECMAVWMRAPHTYTTEDVAEIQCHGGQVTAQRVLDVVLRSGARLAEPGEFTKRAFLNGKLSLTEAEAVTDLISASSDLDEYLIESLKAQGCKITSWGVGTNMITSKDCPAFGGVYKLAAVEDKETGEFIPKIKLSENTEKITNPGNKTIYRIYSKTTGKIRADLICLADETFDESKDMIIFDPQETWKKTKVRANTYTLRELLVPVFKNGECVYDSPSVMKIRDYSKNELDTIWDETKRFANPQHVYVDLSDKLYKIKSDLLEKMSLEALEY